jgi:hypothetical protein
MIIYKVNVRYKDGTTSNRGIFKVLDDATSHINTLLSPPDNNPDESGNAIVDVMVTIETI